MLHQLGLTYSENSGKHSVLQEKLGYRMKVKGSFIGKIIAVFLVLSFFCVDGKITSVKAKELDNGLLINQNLEKGKTFQKINSDFNPADSYSYSPEISGNGQFITFFSQARNLVPNDTNEHYDVFVFDQVTQINEMVSISSEGLQGNSGSTYPSINADGRYVVFDSYASNLVENDLNNVTDIFIHDRDTNITEIVSLTNTGEQANGRSSFPSISDDGRYIVFVSEATNLDSADTNNLPDIYLHDRLLGVTTRINKSNSGLQANDESFHPTISNDGGSVVYWSDATNLVFDDTNGVRDIFVYNTQLSNTERVSVASDGTQANQYCLSSSISGNGRFVAFASQSNTLTENDTNEVFDVFVHDRETGQTERVSVASDGSEANNHSAESSINYDGRFIVFRSVSTNLVANNTDGISNIFMRNRENETTEIISVAYNGGAIDDWAEKPSVDNAGQYITFASQATNIVEGDTLNTTYDIFIRDLVNLSNQIVSFEFINETPEAIAGPDQNVFTKQNVTLDGSGSWDPEGNTPLTYAWSQIAGTAVTLSDTLSVMPTFTAPNDPDSLVFSLVVTDSLGKSSEPDMVVVTVMNQAPIADAGPDQSGNTLSMFTLEGSGIDPDDDLPLAYLWIQTGGPLVILSDRLIANPFFIAPGDAAQMTFELLITDSFGLESEPDEVVIKTQGYHLFMPLILN